MMKKIAALLLVFIMSIHFPSYVLAGESADCVADIIMNEYYLELSPQMSEEIQKIAVEDGYDNERIIAMCSLLDEYCEYYWQGLSATSYTQIQPIESFVKNSIYI